MAAAAPVVVHPQAPSTRTEPFEFRREHEGRELTIRGDVYRADEARGAVVFCHGFKGFGRWGFYPYLAPHVAALGFNAITFDFSGSGIGPDRETYTQPELFALNTYTQEIADIAAVVAGARERGWLSQQYGVFGHSRGGGGAVLHSAASPEVGALVTWAAIGHVLRWLPHEAAQWHARGYTDVVNARTGDVLRLDVALLEECEQLGSTTLNVEAAAARLDVPWLLVHGTADETVPVDDAHKLYRAAGGSEAQHVELAIIEGANHVFGAAHPLGDVPAALKALVERTARFFATHLGP